MTKNDEYRRLVQHTMMLVAAHRDELAKVRASVAKSLDRVARSMKRVEKIEVELKQHFDKLFAATGDRVID